MARTPTSSSRCVTAAARSQSARTALLLALSVLVGCAAQPVLAELTGTRYERCTDAQAKLAYRTAEALVAKGDLALACQELRTCVERCPRMVPFHIRYQDVAFALKDVAGEQHPKKAAMLAFYAGLPDRSGSPLRPYFLARLQRLANREAPAQELLQQALKRDAQFYFAYYELGRVWRDAGRPHRAATHFRRALLVRPGHLDSRRELAECLVELWEWSRAAKQYRTYLQSRPEDFVALREYLSLIIYRVDGFLAEARSALLRLHAAGRSDRLLEIDEAALLWKEGKLGEAASRYRSLLTRKPDDGRVALNLGNLQYEVGRGLAGEKKVAAWQKARVAYRYFRQLGKFEDGFDWFDLHLGVRARLREMEQVLGPADVRPVTLRDLGGS